MILLKKRRSRSETRNNEQQLIMEQPQRSTENRNQQLLQLHLTSKPATEQFGMPAVAGLALGMGRRRTSAEMISEAKTHLGNVIAGGATTTFAPLSNMTTNHASSGEHRKNH